eukprot:m.139161 g.139161  ORF g.139161 m.139161 type:complete len:172 (+) comp30042_c0_seq1:694-1209(+)
MAVGCMLESAVSPSPWLVEVVVAGNTVVDVTDVGDSDGVAGIVVDDVALTGVLVGVVVVVDVVVEDDDVVGSGLGVVPKVNPFFSTEDWSADETDRFVVESAEPGGVIINRSCWCEVLPIDITIAAILQSATEEEYNVTLYQTMVASSSVQRVIEEGVLRPTSIYLMLHRC